MKVGGDWVDPWNVQRGSCLVHHHAALEGAVECGLGTEREREDHGDGELKIIFVPVLDETSRMRARASLQVWYIRISSSLRKAASWLSSIIALWSPAAYIMASRSLAM